MQCTARLAAEQRMSFVTAVCLLLPWVIPALVVRWRQRTPVTLDDYPETIDDPPRVSIVLPARNEARHIAECVAAIRASRYPALELIVVDDHSTDATRTLAESAARGDARVRIVDAPVLPHGWFGKQWACATGATYATGTLLLFTDADTRHAPDLVGRMVRARHDRRATLFSVAGTQEMVTIWERAIQPVIFLLILSRYGSADSMERASRATDVIANGQCLMLDRATYDAIGGHASVRTTVAEDLMLAQTVHRHGGRVSILLGPHQLSTRMYTSLDELIRGWGKNIFAGGRLAMPWGRLGQLLFPVLLLAFPLALLAPFLALPFALATRDLPFLLWSAGAALAPLLVTRWLLARDAQPPSRALLLPLGALLTFVIIVRATVRGARVEWKGRDYTSR